MKKEELRTGNRFYWKPAFLKVEGSSKFEIEITEIFSDKVGYVPSHLEHRAEPFQDDIIADINQLAKFSELEPIPLNAEWVSNHIDKNIVIPEWVQLVHELQNWFYWTHEKRELEIID